MRDGETCWNALGSVNRCYGREMCAVGVGLIVGRWRDDNGDHPRHALTCRPYGVGVEEDVLLLLIA